MFDLLPSNKEQEAVARKEVEGIINCEEKFKEMIEHPIMDYIYDKQSEPFLKNISNLHKRSLDPDLTILDSEVELLRSSIRTLLTIQGVLMAFHIISNEVLELPIDVLINALTAAVTSGLPAKEFIESLQRVSKNLTTMPHQENVDKSTLN